MHEHGAARDLLARLQGRFAPGRESMRARSVALSVREGSGIDPHFLEHGLEEESGATIFHGARFIVTERPMAMVCASCGLKFPDGGDGRCARCGGSDARPEGDEIACEEILWERR